ncbi:ABC transporter substrate-binding protein [Nonomuraea jabiensis]|uniref:ABC transporter substrate-binding protein n=1 Tax=Nonomuraea jabiensis TaxID=882448 RepID=UPI003D75AC41
MSGPRCRRRVFPFLLTVTVLIAAGCSGGDTHITKGGGPEKASITIGMLPLPEVAPIQIAIDKGYFKEQGLTVTAEIISGGAAALPDLATGKLDVLHSNYVSALLATAGGAAKIKVVAEAYAAKPDNFVLMTKKDSPIQKLPDLKGKMVGVNTLNNVATLAVSALLKTAGLTPADIKFFEKPFPEMAGALDSGTVDAAVMPEPFWQVAQQEKGARVLSQLFTGATADFPMAGYLVTEKFAQQNPQTVAAFQRGLRKAVELAISNPGEVKAALGKYTKIKPATTDLLALGGFSTSVDPTRLQRVADLMLEYGYLKTKFNASSMLLAKGTS